MNLHELVHCVYQCPVNHSRSSQDETCNLTKLRPPPHPPPLSFSLPLCPPPPPPPLSLASPPPLFFLNLFLFCFLVCFVCVCGGGGGGLHEVSTPLNNIRCLFSAQSSKTHVKHRRCLIQIGSSYVKGAMAARQ